MPNYRTYKRRKYARRYKKYARAYVARATGKRRRTTSQAAMSYRGYVDPATIELKNYDSYQSIRLYDGSQWSGNCINGIPMGPDQYQRIGRVINMKYLLYRCSYLPRANVSVATPATTTPVAAPALQMPYEAPVSVRFVVWVDTQPNATPITSWSTVFDGPISQANSMICQPNLAERLRIRILKDKVITMERSKPAFFKGKIDLQNLKVVYNSVSTGGIGSVKTNALYAGFFSDVDINGLIDIAPAVLATWRLRYVDP